MKASAVDDRAIRELEDLIQRGREILAVCGWNGSGYDAFRPGGIWVLKFRSRALAVVERVFGNESEYRCGLDRWIEDPRAVDRGYYVPEILSVVQTAYSDVCRDRVFNAAPELLATLGNEIIEVAETLANAGDLTGAASRASDVLRRMLGQLALRHLVDGDETGDTPDPDTIIDALLSASVISTSDHLKIGAYLQIARDLNSAADRIPDGELREMVRWVSDLTRRYRV